MAPIILLYSVAGLHRHSGRVAVDYNDKVGGERERERAMLIIMAGQGGEWRLQISQMHLMPRFLGH